MDSRLQERLNRWHNHIEVLEAAERQCLTLEASEKPLWSALFLAAEGKTVSEREAKAFVHEDWIAFQAGLVAAKVEYNREKRHLELKQSAFQSEYLGAKNQAEAVQKYPKGIT